MVELQTTNLLSCAESGMETPHTSEKPLSGRTGLESLLGCAVGSIRAEVNFWEACLE